MTPKEIVTLLRSYSDELEEILGRFRKERSRVSVDPQDNFRLRGLVMELIDLLQDHVPDSAHHARLISESYNEGIRNIFQASSYASVEELRSLIVAVVKRIERNPGLFVAPAGPVTLQSDPTHLFTALDQIILRFPAVVVQLRQRHDNRSTLDVNDEFDVQDLMHALPRIHFKD